MVKQSSRESGLPGFHAHNSLAGSYETDSLLVNYHEDLVYLIPAAPANIDPDWQDCYDICIEACAPRGPARAICVSNCAKNCPCPSGCTPCNNGFWSCRERERRNNICFWDTEPC